MVLDPSAQVGNLPAEVTSFVGRRHEVAAAKRLLSGNRLLTLTGAGGVGKSRLALRVASHLRRGLVDEVWWVDLAPLATDDLLVQTTADTLGLRSHTARHPMGATLDYLADRRVLLVLDNCGHLLPGCAQLVDTLLRNTRNLRILATSRQALGVPGEQIFVVPSLSVPKPGQPISAQDLLRYDAVKLLAERTSEITGGFRLPDANRADVIRLCQRLDGIPLAIELAAVRLATMPLHHILSRLNGYLEILRRDDTAALPRQRILHATLNWSFDLCTSREQTLWARLAVFSGGIDLQAAEEVCSDQQLAHADVLDALAGLIDKSILVRVPARHGAHARYRLLEPIREYGRQKLVESGQENQTRLRHRDWCLCVAARSERAWLTPTEIESLAALQEEHANLRTAIDFSLTQPDQAVLGLRIATALSNYWYASGRLGEGLSWLTQALDLVPDATPIRVKALWAAGRCALLHGDTEIAEQLIERCLTLANRLDNHLALASAHQDRGLAEMQFGDPNRAADLLTDTLTAFRELDESYGTWYTLYLLSFTESLRNNPAQSTTYAEQCLALAESKHANWARSHALLALGAAHWQQRKLTQAAALLTEALRLKWVVQDHWGCALCIEALSWTTTAADHHERAAKLAGAAQSFWQLVGVSPTHIRQVSTSHQWCETELRRTLGRGFPTAIRKGERLRRDQAIAYALGERRPRPPPPG